MTYTRTKLTKPRIILPKEEVICVNCGISFKEIPSKVAQSRKYCGMECMIQGRHYKVK